MTERLRDLANGRAEPERRGLGAWFAGRARRREYWLWVVPLIILIMVLGAFDMTVTGYLVGWLILISFIRRLHDLGHSGWWAPVINLGVTVFSAASTFLIGGAVGALVGARAFLIVVVVLGSLPGQAEANEYDPPVRRVRETFS